MPWGMAHGEIFLHKWGCMSSFKHLETPCLVTGLKVLRLVRLISNRMDTVADMFGDGDLLDAFQFAGDRGQGNPVFTGDLGTYLGVRFVESTNAQIWSSAGLSGADVYATLVIGANAYGITELDAHSAKTYFVPPGGHTDPLEQSWRNGWKAAHVCKILDQNNIVRVEHNTSYSLSA